MSNAIKLKVCGMQDVENIRDVAALHPEYMGFIFYKESPRYIGDGMGISSTIELSIKRVGVFVHEDPDVVVELVKRHTLHYVQLHGDETPAYCEQLFRQGIQIIKAFRVDDAFDFNAVLTFKSFVKFFLFDTKGETYGGTGKRFNWNKLNEYDQEIPFFLSGGIREEHLEELAGLNKLNMHAIDINSGVEVRPGLKNVDRIRLIKNYLNTVTAQV